MSKLKLGIAFLAVASIAGASVFSGVTYHQQIGSATAIFLNRRPVNTQLSGQLYTCGMHPQIIRDKPGMCPICGMPLEIAHSHTGNAGTVLIDPAVIQNMGVRVAPVTRGDLTGSLRAVGTFVEEEQNHLEINLRVSGWIQKLHANQDGMMVSKGDPLFDLYSPELTFASDELIGARKSLEGADGDLKATQETILAAARRKLSLLGLAEEQIDAIAKLDKSPATITFTSPMTGHITEKEVVEGSAVKAGDKILKIATRAVMWLDLQVYETQLARVEVGATVHVKVAALPAPIDGKVDFIYPHLDMMSRTAKIRVVITNASHAIREGMYADAEIETKAGDVMLMVPREAIIDSGVRQVVFISEPDGHFSPREVKTGMTGHLAALTSEAQAMAADNMVAIESGLKGDEIVVTSGQFLLDAESRMQESLQKYLNERELVHKPATVAMGAPDMNVDAVVKAYLDIAAFFETHEEQAKPDQIEPLALAATTLKGDTRDDAIRALAADLVKAAKTMDGIPVEGQRLQLKNASAAIIGMLNRTPLPEGMSVLYEFHCPMKDGGDWLQTTNIMANPYYPEMRTNCGTLTRTIGKEAGSK